MAAALVAATPATAQAATLFVPCFGTNGGAAGLVDAIDTANGNGVADTIVLAPLCTYTLDTVDNTLQGPNGLPTVTTKITISGNGATIRRSPDTSTPDFRIFMVVPGGDLTLNNLSVRGGRSTAGGGIFASGSTLTLNNGTIHNNEAIGPTGTGAGGGIALASSAVAVIRNSRIQDNTATGGSAGIGGGIAVAGSSLTVTGSTVRRNTAMGGSGGQGGGIWAAFSSTLNFSRGIVSGNTATGTVALGGGIVAAVNGTAQISGASVRGNTANATGTAGEAQGGGIFNGEPMTVSNSAISANIAQATGTANGGGIFNTSTLTRSLSAIAGNVPNNCVNSRTGTGC